ncbi:diguanylate cyclase domain-containing protein [Rhodanobacter terrae]|uniref:histidine kinase n=1 Tax=Rhodanobacter terrae TaxID=418647 RepID=A0ABW0T1Q5_9GAMM
MVTDRPHAAVVAAAKRALALLEDKRAGTRHRLRELWRKLTHVRHLFGESRTVQLLEANQHLVLAALHADDIAEMAVADLAAVSVAHQRDVVTGALTRAFMLDRLQSALLMAQRHQRRLAVMFVDLDHFKPINDHLGHAGGDEVLQIVARALQSVLRESDTLCRYGGDEFLVLLPEISAPDDAGRIAAEMLAAISVPVSVGGRALTLSASLGISIYPEDGDDVMTLINRADAAMYLHKRDALGGFQFHIGEPRHRPGTRPRVLAGQGNDAWRVASPDSPLQDLSEANAQLMVAALTAQESAALAMEAQRQQVKSMAIVAHELRNPLTPLRLAADMLVNPSATSEIPIERLQVIIDDQVTYMTRLIDDLLDGSRLSAGKLRIECTDIDLRDVLNQVEASCRPGMEFRQQHFSMRVGSEPIRMVGDPVRLAQVFSNLLDNACKYTPEKGEIALELLLLNNCAVITVRDNGIGISAEVLPTIFDLFVQDARALSHSNAGLGIGLAVVRELVEAHGGSVVAQSAGREHGSEFVVTLPRSACDSYSGPDRAAHQADSCAAAGNRTRRIARIKSAKR